ncbi:MAG: hypothetical protein RB294_02270, partial [Bacteroidales bacterium]|nr:hypothetical protein [Bacteroidales bacterium]
FLIFNANIQYLFQSDGIFLHILFQSDGIFSHFLFQSDGIFMISNKIMYTNVFSEKFDFKICRTFKNIFTFVPSFSTKVTHESKTFRRITR